MVQCCVLSRPGSAIERNRILGPYSDPTVLKRLGFSGVVTCSFSLENSGVLCIGSLCLKWPFHTFFGTIIFLSLQF